ncbi:LysR family transcriptional regulator [Achromobacter spanius]|uniref:LysR family transcriptional regulator n=1 Tax=Achromobacter spanius TaxID=217203 RepID=A0A2S5GT13_9BURK|nr:LysR family transcriptional regulator [Achromobacter spanius]PPA76139.1 LysR family transcriptional regulator [Achromobacter spanius]HCQ49065.1 LysR family transcriptional regulator [Achromobacter sp.]
MEASTVQLNDIALFVEVAKRKSFSMAARALDMPTSTLSRRINELERAIGLRLINRNTRRLDLTEAGAAYMRRCQGLIDEARLAHEQLLSLSGGPSGNLRVSMPYSLAMWLLPETIKDFTDQYPDVECEFDLSMMTASDAQGTPFDVVLRFGRDGDISPTTLDVGHGNGNGNGNGGDAGRPVGAVVQELVSLDNYLYASERYLQRHGEPRTPGELTQHQCLRTTIDDAHSYWTLHDGTVSEVVPVSGHLAANNMSIAGTLAGLDLAITRMPNCLALDPIIKRNSLRRVLPGWSVDPISIYAVYPSSIQPAKTRAFMDFIKPKLGPAPA